MPMSKSYKKRLSKVLPEIINSFGTPFHIYDEQGIKQTCDKLKTTFKNFEGFKEFFAIKALPNPSIMKILKKEGFGFDCSSEAEIYLSRKIGCFGEDIMFSSNNTTKKLLDYSLDEKGCILNLDDISLISTLDKMPEMICFRYNPGPKRKGNIIIGNPIESKYGVSHAQIINAYERTIKLGAKRFGIHTMLASNELDFEYMVETAKMLLDIVKILHQNLVFLLNS